MTLLPLTLLKAITFKNIVVMNHLCRKIKTKTLNSVKVTSWVVELVILKLNHTANC